MKPRSHLVLLGSTVKTCWKALEGFGEATAQRSRCCSAALELRLQNNVGVQFSGGLAREKQRTGGRGKSSLGVVKAFSN